ncbi:hypothetical protein [Sphingomonas pseudosanguinis]|uniref:ACT domain-containing protein n=1 Tax=Sphingomonas pseudosanguinis TaxID=413712 RepID=A0A7W6ABW6_9SPHN|nr:hypothetical protein [Sphingomonas pseudosanguinis]MBB3877871.1 hypothetical protein [Sphingomonas pseudosanguinis]MBN3537745.1 hypothetical protein [Sphingomonas pseudosanguinis]
MFMERITPDSVILTPVVALADQLEAEMSGLEDAFRQTGETLASAIDTIDGMARGVADIRRSLSPETAGAAVERLRQVAYRLTALPVIQRRRAVEVETLTGRARELRRLLEEVGTILKLLGIYGMNIKIASSGEAAFFNFVVGMDEKLASGRQELHHIEKELDQFGQVVSEVQKADRSLAAECQRAGDALPTELTSNANALQEHVEAVMRMTDEADGVMRTVQGEVARILGAIQIGDSVRQRAEHGITILRRIAAHDAGEMAVPVYASAHMARLVAAQLEAMAADFGQEINAIVPSLERLGPLADTLRMLLEANGGDDGRILVELETGIAKLGHVTDQLCQADAQLAELTGFVGQTLADLTSGLARIQNIAVNVQDISTNTQLLCRRHGTLGRAVAVIAKEVAPCASRLDQLSIAVGQLIGVLAAIDLVQDAGAADTRHVLSDALTVVRGACDSSGAAMARAGGQALRIAASLEATASDLAQQRGFVETLRLAGQSLSLYADHVAPPVDPDGGFSEADEESLRELMPWAARLYTMACERDIHAAFLRPGMAPMAAPVSAVTFDDDDDGLF